MRNNQDFEGMNNVGGIAFVAPISWFEDGSIDCYQQNAMQDIEIESIDDYFNATYGRYEIALDLIQAIQGLSGMPFRYYFEDREEIHILRLQ